MSDRWIVIPGWDKFQHRDAGRSGRGPIWIRDYADQLHKDEYRELTYHQRGLLRDLRQAFAATQGQLRLGSELDPSQHRGRTESLSRRFGATVKMRDLEALANAGFIVLSASKPPALIQQPAGLDVDVDVLRGKKPRKPVDNGAKRCPHCGISLAPPLTLTEHIHLQHQGGDAP